VSESLEALCRRLREPIFAMAAEIKQINADRLQAAEEIERLREIEWMYEELQK
jgi:hypothetical protein